MAGNFTKRISYDGKTVSAVIIPQMRKNGMYYEISIKDFPRFYMTWSPADRYDLAPGTEAKLPNNLTLALSDVIEEEVRK